MFDWSSTNLKCHKCHRLHMFCECLRGQPFNREKPPTGESESTPKKCAHCKDRSRGYRTKDGPSVFHDGAWWHTGCLKFTQYLKSNEKE